MGDIERLRVEKGYLQKAQSATQNNHKSVHSITNNDFDKDSDRQN